MTVDKDATLDESREEQEDDGGDDEPELFLQRVLVMMMLMRCMGLVFVMVFVRAAVTMMFVFM